MPLGKSSSDRDTTRATRPTEPVEPRSRRNADRPSANLFILRVGALVGVVGLATALGAILISAGVQGWLTGLIIGLLSGLLTIGVWSIKEI